MVKALVSGNIVASASTANQKNQPYLAFKRLQLGLPFSVRLGLHNPHDFSAQRPSCDHSSRQRGCAATKEQLKNGIKVTILPRPMAELQENVASSHEYPTSNMKVSAYNDDAWLGRSEVMTRRRPSWRA